MAKSKSQTSAGADGTATPPAPVVLDAGLFINRELSWLEFNERVLEEARDPSNPLLDRLKFLAICSSNLDEFFEVRVAGLQAQLYENLEPQDPPPDGMGPLAQLLEISKRAHDFVARLYDIWLNEVRPELERKGIRICAPDDLTAEQNEFLDGYFRDQVYPVLTPLAIDPAHPFPHVHNKSLNLLLRIESINQDGRLVYAVLQVPSVLPRLVPLPDEPERGKRFVLLEDVIGPRLDALFGGYRTVERVAFRATRNSDLSIQENEVKISLLSTIEENLRQRKWGAPVRLEISDRADGDFLAQLLTASALELEERDVYKVPGPVDLTVLNGLYKLEDFRDLREPPWEPRMRPAFTGRKSVFRAIREQDFLVHHPYESFGTVVQFIEQASEDPSVLAIKMTLYRTADSNPIITALIRAAENGKQVTALVELQARLDEENNIDKARLLQKAGVHVVYGIVGLKTHCKAALVVRREHDGIHRYVHLGTGNYNHATAKLYTDLSYFTCRPEIGEDASALFNLLTGYSQGHAWNRLVVAPMDIADRLATLIRREARHAREGRPARIVAKMNSLVDPKIIAALYEASRDGVQIDLIVRGICCLRPGVPSFSDHIKVRSIVDRFLEHSRITYFANDGEPEVFLSSADWMPRNFRRRVELMFPIEAPALRARVIDEILALQLRDNVKARELQADGTYKRVQPEPNEPALRSQVEFQRLAVEAASSIPIAPVAAPEVEFTPRGIHHG
mgnify:CR=1 FL=1